jgi:hypothetical protein
MAARVNGCSAAIAGRRSRKSAARRAAACSDGDGAFGQEDPHLFPDAAVVVRDDGNPEREGFKRHATEGFGIAGQREDEVGGRHDVADVGAVTEERDAVGEAERGDATFEFLAEAAPTRMRVSEKKPVDVAAFGHEGSDHVEKVFLAFPAREACGRRSRRRPFAAGKSAKKDARKLCARLVVTGKRDRIDAAVDHRGLGRAASRGSG